VEEIRLTPTDVLAVASLSDVGCVRKNNEDSKGVFAGADAARGHLFIVADGMGGAAAGEVASGIAVETVRATYFEPGSGSRPSEALRRSIEAANASIHRRAVDDPKLGGMGTTCTAVAIVGRQIWYAHVGDTRAYVAANGSLTQLTRDHSLAAELARSGGEGGAPARAKNVLTRCLGVKPEVKVDVAEEPVMLPDEAVLVMCTDGLTNLVEDGEILHVVSMHLPDGACKRLISLAKERGGPDNITAIVARLARG
jgi:serine/threonine protein phosphatase PrpC